MEVWGVAGGAAAGPCGGCGAEEWTGDVAGEEEEGGEREEEEREGDEGCVLVDMKAVG